MKPRRRRLSRVLDVLVAIHVIGALLFGLFGVVAMGSSRGRPLVERVILVADQQYPILPVLAAMSGVLVLLWMLVWYGVQSPLWNWLPPFVLFPKDRIIRWIMGLSLGIVTLVTACGVYMKILL